MHFHEWFDYNIRIIILRQLKLSKKTIDSLNFQAGFCFWHLMDEYSIYCCESLTKSKRHYENFVCCENTLKRNYYKTFVLFCKYLHKHCSDVYEILYAHKREEWTAKKIHEDSSIHLRHQLTHMRQNIQPHFYASCSQNYIEYAISANIYRKAVW